MSSGAASLHAPVLETSVAGSSIRVRPRVTNGGDGVATLHTLILETLASGPSARVRPRVTDGGGGKEDDESDVEDVRPGMGMCHGRSKKYEGCNTASGGPRYKHALGGATTSDRR